MIFICWPKMKNHKHESDTHWLQLSHDRTWFISGQRTKKCSEHHSLLHSGIFWATQILPWSQWYELYGASHMVQAKMVPLTWLEQVLLAEPHFECGASTNSATGACTNWKMVPYSNLITYANSLMAPSMHFLSWRLKWCHCVQDW